MLWRHTWQNKMGTVVVGASYRQACQQMPNIRGAAPWLLACGALMALSLLA